MPPFIDGHCSTPARRSIRETPELLGTQPSYLCQIKAGETDLEPWLAPP